MPSRTLGLLLAAAVLLVAAWLLRPDEAAPPSPATPAATGLPAAARDPAPALDSNLRQDATPPAPPPPATTAAVADAASTDRQLTPTVTVRGRVVDARGQAIAAAAVVRLDSTGDGLVHLPLALRSAERTTTAADGTFTLGLPAAGPFVLRAEHADHAPAEQRGAAPLANGQELVITLRDGATITGRIVGAPADAGTITIVARGIEGVVEAVAKNPFGALVDLGSLLETMDLPLGDATANADADGSFVLRGLDPDRRYRLAAAHQPAGATMPQRCTTSVEVGAGARGVELPWREPFTIVARVLDAATGRPLETLDVAFGPVQEMKVFGQSVPVPMLMPRPERTFANGEVVLRGIAVDPDRGARFGVQFAAVGRRSWTRDDLRPPAQGRLDLGVIQLAPAPTVLVTVTHRGQPVAGAEVRLETTEGPAATGQPRVRHSISFSANVGDDTPDAAKALATTPRALQRDRAVTGADGTCELTAEQAVEAKLVVKAAGLAPAQSEPFRLPERGPTRQTVELLRGATAIVRVLDGRGQPLAGVAVRDDGPDGGHQELAVDERGHVRFEHLAPGQHGFVLVRPQRGGGAKVGVMIDGRQRQHDTTRAVATFADGDTQELLLQEPQRGSLRGTVTLDGEPLARAELRLTAATDAAADAATAALDAAVADTLGGLFGAEATNTVKTDAAGEFVLHDVPTGDYRLVITHREMVMPAELPCRIEQGDNRHDAALRRTILRGRVLDDAGAAVAGATVTAEAWTDGPDTGVGEATAALRDLFGGGARGGVRSDDDGRFELAGVSPGSVLRVRATAPLHVAAEQRVDAVTAGEVRDGLELRLAAAGRVRVRATGEGAITVVATWAGAEPAPPGPRQRTQVLKNGRATFDGLPPGPWRLQVEGGGDAPRTSTVEVAAGQTLGAEL